MSPCVPKEVGGIYYKGWLADFYKQIMNIFQQTTFKWLLGAVLVLVVVALAMYAHLTYKQAQGTYTGDLTISVSGEGEVMAVPDIGQFYFTVRSEAEDADTTQSDNAERVNEIIDYLKDEGIEEKDIKTQNYNLNPRYSYEWECDTNSYCPPGERVLTGFEVSQTVSVKVRDIDEASGLLSGVGSRGATDISNLQFTVDDEDSLLTEARSDAIQDAKAKAETLAQELGKNLHRVVGFYEEGNDPYPYGRGGDTMEQSFAADGMASPQLPVGENKTTVRVNLTYELR